MVITSNLDLNVGQISLTFRNGKLNLRFKSIVTASSATEVKNDLYLAFPSVSYRPVPSRLSYLPS